MLFFSDLRQHNGCFRCLWLLLCGSELLRMCLGISVSFSYKQPIYVATGRMLVLQAQVKRNPGEIVRLVTWDLRNSKGEIRLNTDKKPDPENVRLQIDSVTEDRYGSYTVTVTDNNGDQMSASVEVKRSGNSPQASLSLQCSMEPEGTLWDIPVFSWWVNDVKMTTNQGAPLSSNLNLSGDLGKNYTCAIASSQGTSTVQIIREAEPDPEPCSSCIVSITFAVIEGIALAIVGILFWRYRSKRRFQNGQDLKPSQSEELNL